MAKDQPLGPDRSRLPSPAARPRHDVRDHLVRDQRAAGRDRDLDHEGPEPGPTAGQHRPGGGDCPHPVGPAQGAGHEADREHAATAQGLGFERQPARQLDRGRREGRLGRLRVGGHVIVFS